MSLPYAILGEYTGSVQSGSILNDKDSGLFYVSQSQDIWFGLSSNDAIEVSAFTTNDQTLISWGTLDQSKEYQTVTLTYMDNLNVPHSYSYNELVNPFDIYKNQSILLQPNSDLGGIGVTDGNCLVSYNFIREMAGSPSSSLTIKEISNSRTEVKLIPTGKADTEYDSFCVKKFPIRDVATVLMSITNDLPFDTVYKAMNSLSQYQSGIDFLKFVFFLPDDGSVINFLKNLYEDFIQYKSSPFSQITTRIQGIKSYYTNFLLQNYEQIADFDDIEQQYSNFVNVRLDEGFSQLKNIQNQGITDARQFCFDFFVVYFYDAFVDPLKQSYNDKYFGYFKNVLNFGNNKYFSILSNNYLDERQLVDDPITLIVKLASALPSDINEKDTCWVSNFGMTPYVFTAILQNPVKYQTIKISPPNFGSPQLFINKESSNTLYSSDDLSNSDAVDNGVTVNKNIVELNTDYSDFSNFVVFSSAAARLNIFKNKMIQWSVLSSSLSSLNVRYSSSLSTTSPYQYYFNEQANLTSQMTDIVNSFDGYESYLFSNNTYLYNLPSGSFYSASYVADQDSSATE